MVGWTSITNKYQSQQVNNKCEHNSQGPRNIEKLSSNKTCFMALSRWEPRRAGTRTISHPGFLWSPRRYCSLWADPVLQPTDWHVRQEWHAEGKEINSNPRNFTLEFPVETLPIKPGFSPAPKFTGYIHVPWWFGVCAICKQNCILKSHTPSHWPNLTTLGGLGVCWEARQLSPEVKVMCSSFKSLKMPTCKLDFFWNSAIRNLSETLLFDGSAAYAAVSPGRRSSLWSCRWFCHDLITAVPHSSVYWHTRSIGCSPCWTPPPDWCTHHRGTTMWRRMSWAALAEDESVDRLQTGSSCLPLPQRPGSVVPRQRPPLCGRPGRPAVYSLGINEHTRRACDEPVNSRRQRVSGGRGSRVEQSAGRYHFVAIAVDIQETAEDRTVCSELSIALPRLTHCFLLLARPFVLSFLFCKVS